MNKLDFFALGMAARLRDNQIGTCEMQEQNITETLVLLIREGNDLV